MAEASDMRDEMVRTLDRVVADHLTTADRESADGGPMSERLWSALAEQGITAIGEAASDISYADALALVARAAYHAAPVPLGDTVLARRILSQAGIAPPEGAMAVARHGRQHGGGMCPAVPYGRSCRFVVVPSGDRVELFAITGALSHGQNHAGEPRDAVDLAAARRLAEGALAEARRRIELEGALVRAVEITGALERALEHSLTWVNERVQFGRTIAKFQAIQHAMAVMASEVAAARAAAAGAVEAASAEGRADWFLTAVAKARAGEAAGKVANAAHAVFGAMGFTREHPLHYATRRLWAWRDEFGSEVVWQAELGGEVLSRGGAKLWEMVAERG